MCLKKLKNPLPMRLKHPVIIPFSVVNENYTVQIEVIIEKGPSAHCQSIVVFVHFTL